MSHQPGRRSVTAEPTDELDRLALTRGYPSVLRYDNGPELVCEAMADWAGDRVGVAFTPPGEPWLTVYVKSVVLAVGDDPFFAFDDATDHYGLRAYEPDAKAVEMDDAALGLACSDLTDPPPWVSVRNASDPQMNAPTRAEETKRAAAINEKYGYWTTVGLAVTCWAQRVDLRRRLGLCSTAYPTNPAPLVRMVCVIWPARPSLPNWTRRGGSPLRAGWSHPASGARRLRDGRLRWLPV